MSWQRDAVIVGGIAVGGIILMDAVGKWLSGGSTAGGSAGQASQGLAGAIGQAAQNVLSGAGSSLGNITGGVTQGLTQGAINTGIGAASGIIAPISNTAGIIASDLTSVITGRPSQGISVAPSQMTVPVSVIPGGSITFQGKTYTSGTTKIYTIQNALGQTMSSALPIPGATVSPSTTSSAYVSDNSHAQPAAVSVANTGAAAIAAAYGNQIDPYAQPGSPVWNIQHGIK